MHKSFSSTRRHSVTEVKLKVPQEGEKSPEKAKTINYIVIFEINRWQKGSFRLRNQLKLLFLLFCFLFCAFCHNPLLFYFSGLEERRAGAESGGLPRPQTTNPPQRAGQVFGIRPKNPINTLLFYIQYVMIMT